MPASFLFGPICLTYRNSLLDFGALSWKTLSNFIGEKHIIVFKKDDVILKKIELDRKVNWLTIILSALGLRIPLLWLSGTNDEYFFDLQILAWSDQFEAENFETADKKYNSIAYRLPTDLEMKFAYELYYTFNAENGVFDKSNPNNQYLIRCLK